MSLPRTLPRQVWAPLLVLLLVSGVISGLLASELPLVQTHTSYGGIPQAWGAAFDLLHELGLGPQRTRAPLSARDVARAQWIIEPDWHARDVPHELAAIEQFAERGGTVLLIGVGSEVLEGLGFGAGLRETEGDADAADAGSEAAVADAGAEGRGRAGKLASHARQPPQLLHGPWLRRPRRVAAMAGRSCAADAVREEEVRVRSSAGVLALERALGKGKLVVLCDAAFLTNEHLGDDDNAALLVDLVLALGPPVFDERCHGLMPERAPWHALGTGFVLLSALSFVALALGTVLYGRRWPARRAREHAPAPPSLELFVGSLAALYRARGRSEPAAVFRAYRAGFLRRLARSLRELPELGGARGAAGLSQRLAQQARQHGLDARWLSDAAAPASQLELAAAVSALERYAAAAHGERER